MAAIRIASSLAQYADGQRVVVVDGSTVGELLSGLRDRYPSLRTRMFDESGRIRPHIAVFLNDSQMTGSCALRATVDKQDEVAIISAFAGG